MQTTIAPQVEAAQAPQVPSPLEVARSFETAQQAFYPTTPKPSDEAMEAAFRAVGFALSARALLFLALVGAFVLALLATVGETSRLWVLTAYCLLVVSPLVFLEVRKGR